MIPGAARLSKLSNRTAEQAAAAIPMIVGADHARFKTSTLDSGREFHPYKDLEEGLAVTCNFANPPNPWERGTKEGFNGLLRQYLPRGRSLDCIGERKLASICERPDCRPRSSLVSALRRRSLIHHSRLRTWWLNLSDLLE